MLNGPGDYQLEVLDADLTVLAASDRGDLGIEEALQVTIATAGTYTVRVTVLASAGSIYDLDGNGVVNVVDLIELLLCFGQPAVPGCEAEDIDGDGTVNVLDLIGLLLNWGPVVNDYLLEVLARD